MTKYLSFSLNVYKGAVGAVFVLSCFFFKVFVNILLVCQILLAVVLYIDVWSNEHFTVNLYLGRVLTG